MPAAFVPIRFPSMTFEAVPLPLRSTPLAVLPEITLPAPVPGVAVVAADRVGSTLPPQ